MNGKNTLHILLVEDNQADKKLIEIYLTEASIRFELHHSETLFDGIQTALNKEIDLVLLDLTLPDSTGFKTLSTYLEKAPNVPVIVLTGLNNEIVGNQAIKAGAQDFLVKGQVEGKLLGRSIRYCLQRFKTQVKLEEVAKELAISEKRYLDAQSMAHFGNWEADLVSNEMKWSAEIYKILGLHPNSLFPTISDYISFVHREDRLAVETFFDEAAKDGQMHKMEHRILVDGKTVKHLAIQAKAHYEEINNKLMLIGVVQDITERRLTEQLIIEKNMSNKTSKLQQETLEEMGFHIRTPLSSIVNLLYLIENTAISNQQREYIEGLKTSIDDLSLMVHNLLNFSFLVSEKVGVEEEVIGTKNFFNGVHKILQIKAENAGVPIQFQVEEVPANVISDYNKLTLLFYNLLDNVLRTQVSGKEIIISATSTPHSDRQIMLSVEMFDKNKSLTHTEAKALLESEKLLEVFNGNDVEELDKQGLSMGIVMRQIKLLKGKIQIRPDEEKGTHYDISLPIKIPMQVQQEGNGKPLSPLRILLVEDHFLNQIATKKVLTTWSGKVTVDIAENGLIAVEKFFEHGYDIILMDIQMPVMDGIEATSRIREKSQVPIIALTANASKQESSRCLEVGMNEYMAKPFKPQELYGKIMQLLVAVNS